MKPSSLFTIHSKNEARWSTLIVSIFAPKLNGFEGHDELISFHWQSNADARHEWYGFHAEVHHRNGELLKHLQQAAKVVGKILSGERGEEDPAQLIAKLPLLGIQRAAHDGRVSRYVPESQAISPALCQYLDDWTQYRGDRSDGCSVSGLALDEGHAQVVLEKAFLASVTKGHTKAEHFAAWISAGRPVREGYKGKEGASYPPIAELLNTPAEQSIAA